MPPRTLAYLLAMMVPVIVLAALDMMERVATVDLKAALITFTGAAGAALGYGFVKDAQAINEAKRKSTRRLERDRVREEMALRARRADTARRLEQLRPDSEELAIPAASSSAETTRQPTGDIEPGESYT